MLVELCVPCTYQGAKQRLAKQIVNYLFSLSKNVEHIHFYDLCCGSGAITVELLNRGIKPTQIIMCDASSYGKFWKSIGDDTFDINIFYKYSKQVPTDKRLIKSFAENLSRTDATIDEEYKYIILQSCSFGGKQIWREGNVWKNTSFCDYWQPTETSNRRSPVNPMHPEIDKLEQRILNISKYCKGLTCYNEDINNMINVLKNDNSDKIIYIDPPYINTTKYGFDFNHQLFVYELTKITNSPILLSEYKSYSDVCVRLDIEGAKGGISGNRDRQINEYLNFYNIDSDDLCKIHNIIKPNNFKKKLF